MNATLKKIFQYALFLSIGAVLLWFTFSKLDPQQLFEDIRTANYLPVMQGVGLGIVAIIFRGVRWVQLLSPLGYEVKASRSIWAVAVSYLINLITPRVGELARCTALNRTDKVPVDKLFGTVVLERVVDTIMFGLIFLFTLLFKGDKLWKFLQDSGAGLPDLNALTIALLFGIALAGVLLVYFTRGIWKDWSIAIKIQSFVLGLSEGFRSLRRVKNKPLFWFYSFGIWACYVGTIAVGFYALEGLDSLHWTDALLISVGAGLGYLIPVPGGFGAYHYLVSKTLFVLGIPMITGTAFATIIHSSQTLLFIVLGLLGFVFLYFARRK